MYFILSICDYRYRHLPTATRSVLITVLSSFLLGCTLSITHHHLHSLFASTATSKSSSNLSTGPVLQESDTLPLAVAKEARVSDMELMDDRLGDEEWNIDGVEK